MTDTTHETEVQPSYAVLWAERNPNVGAPLFATVAYWLDTGPETRTYYPGHNDWRFVNDDSPVFEDRTEAVIWMIQHPFQHCLLETSEARHIRPDDTFAAPV